jgi:hypothetical protein
VDDGGPRGEEAPGGDLNAPGRRHEQGREAGEVLRKKRNDLGTAFVDALRADEELRFAREVLGSQEETVRRNETRLRAGAIPEVDVIRLRLELRNALNEVLQLEFQAKKARSDLHELLGLARGNEPHGTGFFWDVAFVDWPGCAITPLGTTRTITEGCTFGGL